MLALSTGWPSKRFSTTTTLGDAQKVTPMQQYERSHLFNPEPKKRPLHLDKLLLGGKVLG